VHAAGVNFADLMMRAGLYGTVPPRPFSPGFEVAGVVQRVGADVRSLAPGDRARVTASALNQRNGPSTSYGILRVMPNGSSVTILEVSGGDSTVPVQFLD